MATTTIKVDSEVRDRLAALARERGCTIGDLVRNLADTTPTRDELDARHRAAVEYIRGHLVPDFDESDVAAGRRLWDDLKAGKLTSI
ncbi:hypothetical protein [Actinomadura alba]|uniref:Ribbon-helix-helix protein, CopG family n=1 Tax=Actinomadura alba TaxID=406431 RepID=A0ABR7LJD6_9ACTN|nr:hypothetical protein [Actinomadura alba]MBC6464699.1 hypothetical protein [Actinomadura alba]